jgi:CHAD domain-containing protein
VKPERVDLRGVERVEELVERVLQMRLREVRALTTGLERRDNAGLHDFRIACKRLRYAIERFAPLEPSLETIGERLALLQDALGGAHDRDVLLAILPPSMSATERRLKAARDECVDRAVVIWQDVEQRMRALDSHRI